MNDTTTLAIEKSIYSRAGAKAKNQHLSVSAVARMLLEAYAQGKIKIAAVSADESEVEFGLLAQEDITPAIKKAIKKSKKLASSDFINLS